MSKQIQVNLAFNADTAKAKQQINDLVNSLNQISNKNTQIFDDREFREAANAARDLTKHLEAAVNVNTGKLDLNKFSQSLSQSKQSLSDLYNSLSKAGPQGQQAFLQLASSIASSESQVLNLNSKVKDLGQTLKNTVKWQLSSSLVHGFMGALQHAFGYAQDLNSSLNDIRIVTGASAEEMAKFAEQANKSAKALSSTTNEYAKASLIYYQQGLSDSEVQERTDITIKMANVSKESAQTVSDQMTAVWNNFYDGSKSLEYYADVMTALGAATASSVDEIAGGLEKFAAIGDTIGLSYEYAASALATITSNTRQSEEVVGTALKTIFARIQGLNLGETLDDGTTLNKYSAALDKVGISIFDQAGELKAMDNILAELGSKWQTLSKDQQIALAQTVAGVRQYTQLVALMDNWDSGDSDSFMANLNTAYGSEGALQEQQEIYAQSWEAAADKVTAAVEDIYDSLINDEAIIILLNGLEKVLNIVGSLIDGFGGMQGILLLIGATFTKTFSKEMPEVVEKLKTNFKIISGQAEKEKQKNVQDAKNIITGNKDNFKNGNFTRANATTEELESLLKLEAARDRLSDSQYEYLRSKIAEKKASKEAIAVKEDEIAQLEKEYQLEQRKNIKASSKKESKGTPVSKQLKLEEESDILEARKTSLEQGRDKLLAKIQKGDTLSIKQAEDLDNYNQELQAIEKRNAALQESINLEKQRQEIISKESLDIKNDDGESIGIDHKAYEAAISERTQKLQNEYQKQAASRLVLEDYEKQISSWTSSAGSMKIKNLGADEQKKEVDKLKQSVIKYAEELNKANNIEFTDDKLKDLKDSLKDIETNAGEVIDKFKEFASVTQVDKATAALEETTQEVQQLQKELKALTPDEFDKIDAEAREAAENIATAQHKLQQLENSSNQIDVNIDVDASNLASTLTDIGSLAMDTAALFTELGVVISTVFDSNATLGEKLTATITGLGSMALTSMQIFSTLANPGFLAGLKDIGGLLTNTAAKGGLLSGVLGKLGAGFTTAGGGAAAATLAFGKILLVIGLVIGAIKLLTWLFDTFSPEGKLEAVKQTTEAMATAANDANTAYQNLLNTLSGYNSAVSALEGLEVGTQEFTNALITANEKAWELIDTYGLIQGQDWEYGENGEIIIKHSAQDRITKEASNIREDAIIAQSATEIQEKQAKYNIAKNEAGYFGSNLTEDVRQNLYKALGMDTGSSKQLEKDWYAAETEEAENAIIEKVGRKLHGEKWDSSDSEMVDFIRSALFNMDKISNMFDAYTKYNTAKENQLDKQISTVMSDEKAYQKTSWKEVINELLGQQKQEAINETTKKLDAKTDEQIKKDYEDYLKQTYIEEDGKYYHKDALGKKTGEAVEGLTGLTVEQQKNILAEIEALKILEQQGIDVSKGFNKIANNMTKSQKDAADALMNTDLSKLTDEQIKAFENGELSFKEAIGSSNYEQLSKLLGEDFINKLEEGLKKAVEDYKSEEFNLDAWKKDYAAKMDIVNDLETGDSISAGDYTVLGEEYQQYFSEQLDGTYKLIGTANEFKAIVESIELGKLKEDINTKKGTISQMNASDITTSSGRTLDFNAAHNAASEGKLHETWDEAYIESINEALKTNYITVEEANTAWNNYESSLLASASTLAMSINNFDDLDKVFKEGLITVDDYNKKLKELTDMLDEDVDEEQYENLTEIIQSMAEASDENNKGALEFSENLKENEEAARDVAEAILRYDSAVEDVKKNSKDWMKILKSGNLQDMADIMDDLENSYNDLLDLDGSVLSDDFITNTENLELMTKAANGSTEAYDELARRANEDIIAQCRLEADFDSTKFDAALVALQNEIAAIDLPNIEVGCDLMGEESFIAACNDIINAAGMTATEAQAYLGNMGVDATVVSEPEVTEDTTTVVSMIPNEASLSGTALNPATGLSAPYYFPGADYELIPETHTTTKTTTATALKVESATKSSGGGIKHANSSSGSGSKSKPSGGGGGGSKKEPKYAEKKSSSEKTRYHTLQNQLEDLTAEYDALADASDRAFGQDKLDAIDAEIKKTDELIDKQEEYLQAIQSDLPVDKSVMTAYYNDTIGGPAMKFDENGNISNYDQIQDAMFNKYNAMTAYDEDSVQWQTFEKKYEQLEKYIEQYEETYDLLREEEANYQDLLNQRIDLELEKVEYKVEIQLEVPENQKEVIEYQLGRIEDDAKKTGEALALLTEQAEMTYDQILINKQGLNDALELSLSAAEITEVMAGNMDVLNGKTFTEDQISAIQDYKDNLLELNEEFDDIRESIEETVLEAFDMWHEKLEEGIEKFDYFGTILESYQNIIDTVGKDTLGISDSLMNTLSQASVDNAINGVEATRDAYKALQQAQIDAERELERAKARGDEQSISFWESTLNEIQQNAEDAHEEMLSSWEEALSKIVEQFEASVQTAVDAFNEAVYQLGGIEALSEEFDRQKEMADMYLDDYQKIYELSKLNRDVNNSIDDTDSLAGKQKLKKLLGEINKLQADGVKMSEYDLEYLQAEYDLRLAEIALEEAQRAKDVVRLSRDNEGNWSYVYTQNTEAVDEAQQKYEDALYAMQDLSSNYIDEISAQLIETSQEMQEALAAIRIEDYASIEEYYEEVERVQEQYQEQLALQEEELNKAVANNKELYDTDWTNYHNAVGYKISDTEEFATKFSDTLLGTLMNSESDTSNFTNILADATSTLMNELYGAAEQYYTNMAAAMEAAGTTTGTFADDLATNVDQIKQDSEEAATAVEDMATHMQEQMDNIINKVGEWQRTYGEAMNEIINANLAVIDSFNEMLATLSMDDSTVTVKYDIQNHNSDVLDAERFATGGYTGSWGNTGRLGILDEKELILNKDDTENFIEALKISRSMLNTIELNARQASLGLGTLIPTTIKDDIKETLEQVVQITAEFPNATDHNEIEEAFNSLINYSSQYANRK